MICQVYSSFDDNYKGSKRISKLFDDIAVKLTAESNQDLLSQLEFHAYYLPPDDLPVSSLCNLLHQCSGSLERLSIFDLRLGAFRRNGRVEAATTHDSINELVEAVISLKVLRELTWNPLPSKIWDDPIQKFKLLSAFTKLSGLQNLHFTLESERDDYQRQRSLFLSHDEFPNCAVLPTLMQSLVCLRLSNYSWTIESCTLLAQGLKQKKTKLKHLDISSSLFLDPLGCLGLIDSLGQNNSLLSLNLTDCQFASSPVHLVASTSRIASFPLQDHIRIVVFHLMIETLELYNTSLQHVKGTDAWGISNLDAGETSKTLEILLFLNRYQLRRRRALGDSSDFVAKPASLSFSTWPWVLHHTLPYTPTAVYQLVSENVDTLFT